jgi:hypothetical protein
MGRTVPTFTMVIQQEMESWTKFRRGLRKEDQEALDELFRAARLQLAGSAYAARPIPFESVAMSMLLAQHRMIKELQRSLTVILEKTGRAVSELPSAATAGEEEGGRGTDDDTHHHRLAV